MADESMVRNLAAQADAIWPQEQPLFDALRLPAEAQHPRCRLRHGRDLDAPGRACSSGAAPRRRRRSTSISSARVPDARRSASARASSTAASSSSACPTATFDLVVCRHVLQAIPHADRAIAELARVTKPRRLAAPDRRRLPDDPLRAAAARPRRLLERGPRQFGDAIGTDLRIGRKALRHSASAWPHRHHRRLRHRRSARVPRETFAAIWTAWRDGFADTVSQHSSIAREEFIAHFDDMIATLDDPSGYGVWHVPVVSGARAVDRHDAPTPLRAVSSAAPGPSDSRGGPQCAMNGAARREKPAGLPRLRSVINVRPRRSPRYRSSPSGTDPRRSA